MNNFFKLYDRCKKSRSWFVLVLLRALYYKLVHGKMLLLNQHATIIGVRNLTLGGYMRVGLGHPDFVLPSEKTYLNIRGKVHIKGNHIVSKGCRWDIAKDAVVTIGNNGYMNANTKLIIMHRLDIGDECAISWDCQFLDEDFHEIQYEGKKDTDSSIIIGNHVWIGCGARIYKGTVIADGCVVASDSVVRGKFLTPNCIIGGNPAKVIKENIVWK